MVAYDVCLTGGQVLLPGFGLQEIDVVISGGRIVGFFKAGSKVDAIETVPIHGLVVLPGAIDPHVHLGQDITYPKTPADVTKESAAAASGGVTTFLVYLMSPEPYGEIFANAVTLMETHSLTDFGVHFCACTAEQAASIPAYVKDLGVASFKFFMNFRGQEGKRLNLPGNDDGFLFQLLKSTKVTDSILCPHAENIELIWLFREYVRDLDLPPLQIWNECAPPFAEAEALQRVAYLAKIVGVPFYAVHVSSAESIDSLTSLRARNAEIFIETCPHYLTHDIDSNIGEIGKVNPPLRTAKDREAIWKAINAGVIDVVGSDHIPRSKDSKMGGIWKSSAGFPGIETLLPILISEGHIKRRIPLHRIINLVSLNPAKIFGIYPQKGVLCIGSDADLTVVDLNGRTSIEVQNLHSAAGYSIYEGWEVLCRVVHTLVRGVFVKRDGEVTLNPKNGKYIPRYHRGIKKENVYEHETFVGRNNH
jgi:dihydropyrimidinase